MKALVSSFEKGEEQPEKTGKKGGFWLILLLGVALLFALRLLPGGEEKTEADNEETYLSAVQTDLKTLLEEMEGVGEVRVMITLTKGKETVYVSGRSQVQTVLEPQIEGVVILCSGAKDEKVRWAVMETVTTLFGIGWDKVSVQKAND